MILRVEDTDFRNKNGKLELCELGKYIDLYKNNEDIDVFEIYVENDMWDKMGSEIERIAKYLQKKNLFVSMTSKLDKERKIFYDYVLYCYK